MASNSTRQAPTERLQLTENRQKNENLKIDEEQGVTCASLKLPLGRASPCTPSRASLAARPTGLAPGAHQASAHHSRRGPAPLADDERRRHCVSVRLNAAELKWLNSQRGRLQKGEWLRHAAFNSLPPPPPPAINLQAWQELARSAANLNQLTHQINLMAKGAPIDLSVINSTGDILRQFRNKLIAADWSDDESQN